MKRSSIATIHFNDHFVIKTGMDLKRYKHGQLHY
jgi:hypothetical protein